MSTEYPETEIPRLSPTPKQSSSIAILAPKPNRTKYMKNKQNAPSSGMWLVRFRIQVLENER
jgi:hypothetical protein